MMSRRNYLNVIRERVEGRVGLSLETHGIDAKQWKRLSELSEVLRQTTIIEEMIRVESRDARKVSSKIKSKFAPAGKIELENSLSSLQSIKKEIWLKCDSIGDAIVQGQNDSPAKNLSSAPVGNSNLIRCSTCGGDLQIIAYNNFKCEKCGLAYSAKDYLENLNLVVERI